jgi:hypothetical protein
MTSDNIHKTKAFAITLSTLVHKDIYLGHQNLKNHQVAYAYPSTLQSKDA